LRGERHVAGGGGGLDMSARDMAFTPQCTGAERRCIPLPVASEGCVNDKWELQRGCPFADSQHRGATCTNGFCQQPQANSITGCGNGGPLESVCEQISAGNGQKMSCQPFITDANVSPPTVDWWCAVAANAGAGGAGASCTGNGQCHSGFCINGTCLWTCQTAADCPLSTTPLLCNTVELHVEGQTLSVQSCTH
jgi:hypothetical protein